jgi:hypothetical protein
LSEELLSTLGLSQADMADLGRIDIDSQSSKFNYDHALQLQAVSQPF